MEPQWTAYSEAPGNRYSHSMTSSPHASRDASVSSQIKQDPYATPSRQSSMPLQSPSGTASRGPDYNDGDGDVPMEDAYKPRLNSMARPQQQQRHSQQYLQQEESAAARRYSPMNLSPTSPYSAGAQQAGQNYTSFTPQAQAQSQGNRQSPTRNNPYMSPPNNNNYYSPPSSRPHAPQLPPIQSNMSPESFYPQSATAQLNAVYNRDARSPRASANSNPPPQLPPMGRGPVPKFEKCVNTADLQPKINAQPPFRRANPEGGFISPLQALTAHLPMTYKLCNGGFNYQSSRNPRRVLTKPSKGVKNDGYDNEDSGAARLLNKPLFAARIILPRSSKP